MDILFFFVCVFVGIVVFKKYETEVKTFDKKVADHPMFLFVCMCGVVYIVLWLVSLMFLPGLDWVIELVTDHRIFTELSPEYLSGNYTPDFYFKYTPNTIVNWLLVIPSVLLVYKTKEWVKD